MNPGQRCSRQLGLLIRWPLQNCSSNPYNPRSYSSAVAATIVDPAMDPTTNPSIAPNPVILSAKLTPVKTSLPHRVASAVVISRPPMLTRDIGEFEASYYFYQRRLNDRLQLPFTRWFYFKKGTLAGEEWKRKQAAADKYNAYGERQWADELLVGSNKHRSEDNGYQYLVDTTVTGEEEALRIANARVEAAREAKAKGEPFEYPTEIIAKPFPRVSKADLENDTRSLDRKMSRTLYLLVRKKRDDHAWRFPQSSLTGSENLREGAERTLSDAAGVNIHTWFVGNVPIGHYTYKYPPGLTDGGNIGKKVFFMKARILAGQVDLTDNKLGLDDFQWLTKEEIERVAGKKYFKAVQHMLVAR